MTTRQLKLELKETESEKREREKYQIKSISWFVGMGTYFGGLTAGVYLLDRYVSFYLEHNDKRSWTCGIILLGIFLTALMCLSHPIFLKFKENKKTLKIKD